MESINIQDQKISLENNILLSPEYYKKDSDTEKCLKEMKNIIMEFEKDKIDLTAIRKHFDDIVNKYSKNNDTLPNNDIKLLVDINKFINCSLSQNDQQIKDSKLLKESNKSLCEKLLVILTNSINIFKEKNLTKEGFDKLVDMFKENKKKLNSENEIKYNNFYETKKKSFKTTIDIFFNKEEDFENNVYKKMKSVETREAFINFIQNQKKELNTWIDGLNNMDKEFKKVTNELEEKDIQFINNATEMTKESFNSANNSLKVLEKLENYYIIPNIPNIPKIPNLNTLSEIEELMIILQENKSFNLLSYSQDFINYLKYENNKQKDYHQALLIFYNIYEKRLFLNIEKKSLKQEKFNKKIFNQIGIITDIFKEKDISLENLLKRLNIEIDKSENIDDLNFILISFYLLFNFVEKFQLNENLLKSFKNLPLFQFSNLLTILNINNNHLRAETTINLDQSNILFEDINIPFNELKNIFQFKFVDNSIMKDRNILDNLLIKDRNINFLIEIDHIIKFFTNLLNFKNKDLTDLYQFLRDIDLLSISDKIENFFLIINFYYGFSSIVFKNIFIKISNMLRQKKINPKEKEEFLFLFSLFLKMFTIYLKYLCEIFSSYVSKEYKYLEEIKIMTNILTFLKSDIIFDIRYFIVNKKFSKNKEKDYLIDDQIIFLSNNMRLSMNYSENNSYFLTFLKNIIIGVLDIDEHKQNLMQMKDGSNKMLYYSIFKKNILLIKEYYISIPKEIKFENTINFVKKHKLNNLADNKEKNNIHSEITLDLIKLIKNYININTTIPETMINQIIKQCLLNLLKEEIEISLFSKDIKTNLSFLFLSFSQIKIFKKQIKEIGNEPISLADAPNYEANDNRLLNITLITSVEHITKNEYEYKLIIHIQNIIKKFIKSILIFFSNKEKFSIFYSLFQKNQNNSNNFNQIKKTIEIDIKKERETEEQKTNNQQKKKSKNKQQDNKQPIMTDLEIQQNEGKTNINSTNSMLINKINDIKNINNHNKNQSLQKVSDLPNYNTFQDLKPKYEKLVNTKDEIFLNKNKNDISNLKNLYTKINNKIDGLEKIYNNFNIDEEEKKFLNNLEYYIDKVFNAINLSQTSINKILSIENEDLIFKSPNEDKIIKQKIIELFQQGKHQESPKNQEIQKEKIFAQIEKDLNTWSEKAQAKLDKLNLKNLEELNNFCQKNSNKLIEIILINNIINYNDLIKNYNNQFKDVTRDISNDLIKFMNMKEDLTLKENKQLKLETQPLEKTKKDMLKVQQLEEQKIKAQLKQKEKEEEKTQKSKKDDIIIDCENNFQLQENQNIIIDNNKLNNNVEEKQDISNSIELSINTSNNNIRFCRQHHPLYLGLQQNNALLNFTKSKYVQDIKDTEFESIALKDMFQNRKHFNINIKSKKDKNDNKDGKDNLNIINADVKIHNDFISLVITITNPLFSLQFNDEDNKNFKPITKEEQEKFYFTYYKDHQHNQYYKKNNFYIKYTKNLNQTTQIQYKLDKVNVNNDSYLDDFLKNKISTIINKQDKNPITQSFSFIDNDQIIFVKKTTKNSDDSKYQRIILKSTIEENIQFIKTENIYTKSVGVYGIDNFNQSLDIITKNINFENTRRDIIKKNKNFFIKIIKEILVNNNNNLY